MDSTLNATVTVIFTGGTIAMSHDTHGRLVPAATGETILAAIPEIRHVAAIETIQLSNVPSAHLTFLHWQALRRQIIASCAKTDTAGVVVVQGTDTLEETAFFLTLTLSPEQRSHKPVVLCGAMRSHDEANADGSDNLLRAIQWAGQTHGLTQDYGVVACMHRRIHSGLAVRKIHSHETDAFISVGCPPIAELSADGQITTAHAISPVSPQIVLDLEALDLPRVDIITAHTDADDALLRHAIALGSAGIVIHALGAGNLPPKLMQGVMDALAQGVAVVVCSRCWQGGAHPIYGYFGGGQQLHEAGAVLSSVLAAPQARLLAQLLLAQAGATTQPIAQLAAGFAQFAFDCHV